MKVRVFPKDGGPDTESVLHELEHCPMLIEDIQDHYVRRCFDRFVSARELQVKGRNCVLFIGHNSICASGVAAHFPNMKTRVRRVCHEVKHPYVQECVLRREVCKNIRKRCE